MALIATLTACSGSSGPTIEPISSTGFARASDDFNAIDDGTVFTSNVTGITSSLVSPTISGTSEMTFKVISPTQIEVTRDGRTDILNFDQNLDGFSKIENNESIFLSFAERGQYGAINRVVIESLDGNGAPIDATTFTGVTGYSTDPMLMPAMGLYNGTADILLTNFNGDEDEAIGAATFKADFNNGLLTGNLAFTDPANDGDSDAGGPASVDLGDFNAEIVGGTVIGNTFTAPVEIGAADLNTSANVTTVVNGNFLGPVGEQALGVGVQTATAAGSGSTPNMLLILAIEAQRN